jgi:5-methylcytosine-specific restriction endonuclease McrA
MSKKDELNAKRCKICNTTVPFHRSAYCSDECSRIAYNKPKMIVCKVCSKSFRRLSSELHCSSECKNVTERKRGAARRQQIRATRKESIDPIVVFNNYDWHCAMCNKPTPRELIGSFDNDSPTLDHRIPLSLGGTHTYDNLQLLCQYCNCSVKRGKSPSLKQLLPCTIITIEPFRLRQS